MIRHSGPIITRDDLPTMGPDLVDPSSVFNPGAVMIGSKTCLLLRVQTRGRRTFTVPAVSDNGTRFKIADQFTTFENLPLTNVHHIYDPRITKIDDQILITTAIDTDEGCRCALWRAAGHPTNNFAGLDRLEFVSLLSDVDTRNAVVFPERLDGHYLLLHRPNAIARANGPTTGTAVHLATSQDLLCWRDEGPVFQGRPHYWDELIGSGPPPIETSEGWLHIYHGIATHFQSANIYQAGAVLLDRKDPRRVLGRTRDNILEPREIWELTGQVPNVVFPSGATTSEEGAPADETTVNIYYGAADTSVGLARTTVGALLAAIRS